MLICIAHYIFTDTNIKILTLNRKILKPMFSHDTLGEKEVDSKNI